MNFLRQAFLSVLLVLSVSSSLFSMHLYSKEDQFADRFLTEITKGLSTSSSISICSIMDSPDLIRSELSQLDAESRCIVAKKFSAMFLSFFAKDANAKTIDSYKLKCLIYREFNTLLKLTKEKLQKGDKVLYDSIDMHLWDNPMKIRAMHHRTGEIILFADKIFTFLIRELFPKILYNDNDRIVLMTDFILGLNYLMIQSFVEVD